ncbi:membrane protein insertion efficiency factor YidD [Candidatus Microgenomates bacterium]|nr:membrane protein insertion efficiency factor YidD [Candidatus Microgenomates bacterium]
MKAHPLRFLALVLIRLYQMLSLVFHRVLGIPDGGGCRFSPTCSEYTAQAIDQYGIQKGALLGLKRLLKCHPWGPPTA